MIQWRKQSLYRGVSIEWARGFARWLSDQGWDVGTITEHGPGVVHIPAARKVGAVTDGP